MGVTGKKVERSGIGGRARTMTFFNTTGGHHPPVCGCVRRLPPENSSAPGPPAGHPHAAQLGPHAPVLPAARKRGSHTGQALWQEQQTPLCPSLLSPRAGNRKKSWGATPPQFYSPPYGAVPSARPPSRPPSPGTRWIPSTEADKPTCLRNYCSSRDRSRRKKKQRKRRTVRRNKAKNRLFRPQKPPQQFYAAVWRGRKI